MPNAGAVQNDFPMTLFVIVIVVSAVGIITLLIVIAVLIGVHRRIQRQSLSIDRTGATLPSIHTLNSGVVYEEPDCQVNQVNTAL